MPSRGTIGQIIETRRHADKELTIEWQISKFFSLSVAGDCYESPLFGFSDGCWHLAVFPNGHKNISLSWVILYIMKKDTGSPKDLHLTFAIKGSKIKVVSRFKFRGGVESYCMHTMCLRSMLKEQEFRLMPDDILTFTCDLKTVVASAARCMSSLLDASIQTDEECREQNSLKNGSQLLNKQDASFVQTDTGFEEDKVLMEEIPSSKRGVEEWQKSLLKLLESGKESDVVIKVQGKEFSAHRLLLQTGSPVFEAMFSHNMVEKQSGIVTLEDCDPKTFPDLLKHIYTGSTEMISTKNVFNLYIASDKYDLKILKEECAEFLKRNLTVASFCDAMALAIKYDEKELIQLATEFFSANTLNILKTVEWQIFLAENLTVGNELFILSYAQK